MRSRDPEARSEPHVGSLVSVEHESLFSFQRARVPAQSGMWLVGRRRRLYMACIDCPLKGKQQCSFVRGIEWNKKAIGFELNVSGSSGEIPDTRRAIPFQVGQHQALLNGSV